MSRRTREILPAAARPERRVPRKARVAGQVHEQLQLALAQLRDPRLSDASVTRVVLSDDLGSARAFVRIAFGPSGPSERKRLLRALHAATGRLRHTLGATLGLRYVPALYFEYDEGLDDARRVAELLEEIRHEPPVAAEQGEASRASTDEPSAPDGAPASDPSRAD